MEEIEPYVRRKRVNSGKSSKLDGLNEEEQAVVRMSINSRERKRMHDLNDALNDLRQTLPYSPGANARKMSKINTIILAGNWIRQLTGVNNELRRQLDDLRERISECDTKLTPESDLTSTSVVAINELNRSRPLSINKSSIHRKHSSLECGKSSSLNSNLSPPSSIVAQRDQQKQQQPCIKSINGLCFCVNCIITSTNFSKKHKNE